METGIKKPRLRLGGLIFALLLAAELAFVLDMVTTRAEGHFPAKALLLVYLRFVFSALWCSACSTPG